MDLCAICKSVPFNRLPSEEEPALPHHPSLATLQESAKRCSLCQIIFQSARHLALLIHNERTGGPHPGGSVSYSSTPSPRDSGGKVRQYATNLGWHSNYGSHVPGPGEEDGPVCMDPSEVFRDDGGVRPWLFGNWWRLGTPDSPLQLVGLGVRLGTGAGIEEAVGNEGKRVKLRGTWARFRTGFGSPLAGVIPGRLRARDSSSTVGFARVKYWLEECNRRHCCEPQRTCLPTRVLDLGEDADSQAVKLVETNGAVGKYIALSHCWGLSHRVQTTKSTIHAYMQGVLFSVLPKTFRDAIMTARILHIRYLWIDTLCICQDDMTDWEHESANMGQVYSNAYLTIAASSSTDDSSGLFPSVEDRIDGRAFVSSDPFSHGRPGPGNVVPDIYIDEGLEDPVYVFSEETAFCIFKHDDGESKLFLSPEWMPSSRKEDTMTYRIGEFGRSFDPLMEEPLSRRGWTLQERLLSPRTLHYGTEQMYWECRECLLAEDGAYFEPSRLRSLPLKQTSDRLAKVGISDDAAADEMEEESPHPYNHWTHTWTRLIQHYTTRSLTFSQDKLPALAGLARTIATNTGDTYLAGHWLSTLLSTLNWRVFVSEPDHMCNDPEHDAHLPPPFKSEVRVPDNYRAPSWSWASIDTRVDFEFIPRDEIVGEVVEHQARLAGSDPFGRLQNGWVKISGPMFPLHPDPSTHINREKFPYRSLVNVDIGDPDVVTKGTAYFDLEPEFPCVALILSVGWIGLGDALVLRRIPGGEGDIEGNGGEKYVRVGVVKFDCKGDEVVDAVGIDEWEDAMENAPWRDRWKEATKRDFWKVVTIV